MINTEKTTCRCKIHVYLKVKTSFFGLKQNASETTLLNFLQGGVILYSYF